jgi:DNA-binding FadR family transcriptional regulator
MESTREAAQFFFAGSEGLAHLEQARLFLEISLLRYAVVHAANAQIAKMLEAIQYCEANVENNEKFREGDVLFHRALAEVPGNPIFVALHDTFVEKLMRNRPTLPEFVERNKTSNGEHRVIVAAMLDKDSDKAVDVLTKHLTRNYGAYFRLALDHGAEATAQLNSSTNEEETHE